MPARNKDSEPTRHLIELLDSVVRQACMDAGQDYRPRYTAADSLDADLEFPLSACLAQAIAVLGQRSFGERIRAANKKMRTTT